MGRVAVGSEAFLNLPDGGAGRLLEDEGPELGEQGHVLNAIHECLLLPGAEVLVVVPRRAEKGVAGLPVDPPLRAVVDPEQGVALTLEGRTMDKEKNPSEGL